MNLLDALSVVKSNLEDRGFKVTRATQYGFHLAAYRDENEHSDYLIEIVSENPVLDGLDVVKSGRVAHTVGKRVLFAIPLSNNRVRYLELRDWNEIA